MTHVEADPALPGSPREPQVPERVRTSIVGPWYLRRLAEGRLSAFHLTQAAELELEGSLAAPEVLERLQDAPGPVGELARALQTSPRERSQLGRLLAPEGFGLLFLELTGRCNERCEHCYASSSPEVGEALESQEISVLLSEAKELGFTQVQLTGGDPLLSPHLLEAARRVRQLGMELEVYTNGLAFRADLGAELADLGAKMALSFYSHDPATHDAITRTPGSQERTLRAILLARELGIQVRVSIIATARNGDDVEMTRRYLVDRGVQPEAIRASRELSVGRGSFRPEQREFSWGAAHGVAQRRLGKLCVTYQGLVVPCIFDRQTVLGDIRRAKLADILAREVDSLSCPRRLHGVTEELSCSDCRFRRRLLQG